MTVVTNWGEAILTALANALNLVLTFIPRLLGFFVILLVGWLVATLVRKALTFLLRKIGFDRLSGALEQLQIAPSLLNELFGALVAAAALAFGLAFGLGGQETARKWLSRGESTMSDAASHMQAQQHESLMETAAPLQANQARLTRPAR